MAFLLMTLMLISMRSVVAALHQMILNISASGVKRSGKAHGLSDLEIIHIKLSIYR
jgi:hypothetical protein